MATLGHSADDLAQLISQIKNLSVDGALKLLGGKGFANASQLKLLQSLGGVGSGAKGVMPSIARFAASKGVNNALRVVPGIGLGISALDAADVVTNDTSVGNKVMDTAAMAIGAGLGSVGGPLGAAAGASTAKLVSDGAQYLFGGGKSAEQRKLEEALALLNGGRI